MNTPFRCTRTGIRFAIAATATAPLLLFASGIASAADATVQQDGDGSHSVWVHITGLAGPGYVSGPDNCSVWLDRDPANSPDPTGGGPASTSGSLDFHKLPAELGDHTVWIKCYHAGKQTPFWEAERTVTVVPPASAAAPAAPAAPAAAQSQLNGAYSVQSPDGQSAVWTFSSCGAGCLHIDSTNGWSGEAHLANGRWSFGGTNPTGWKCNNGTLRPVTMTYSWADGSLTGTSEVTEIFNCIDNAGMVNVAGKVPPTPFTMTKQ